MNNNKNKIKRNNNNNNIINNNIMKNIHREGSTSQKIILGVLWAVEGFTVDHILHQKQTTTKIKVTGTQ